MAEYTRPLPNPTVDTEAYWEGAKRHELLAQKCNQCGQLRFPPGLVCPNCLSTDHTWTQLSGKGEVYTFSLVRAPLRPEFQDAVPYVLGVVQLDEGVRMVTNIVGCPPEDVRIGMRVEVTFDDVTAEITLPKFKPAAR
jgi:uncharacterized OB-fold protein